MTQFTISAMIIFLFQCLEDKNIGKSAVELRHELPKERDWHGQVLEQWGSCWPAAMGWRGTVFSGWVVKCNSPGFPDRPGRCCGPLKLWVYQDSSNMLQHQLRFIPPILGSESGHWTYSMSFLLKDHPPYRSHWSVLENKHRTKQK